MTARLAAVYVTTEDPVGAEETVAATDVIDVTEFTTKLRGTHPMRDGLVRPWDQGAAPALPTERWREFTLGGEVKANADGTDLPEIAALLTSGAWSFTGAGVGPLVASPVTAPNATANVHSCTIRAEESATGREYIAFGCRTYNWSFKFTPAGGLRWSCSAIGCDTDDAATSGTSATYHTGVPLMRCDASTPLVLGGQSGLVVREWSLDIPSTVTRRPSITAGEASGWCAWPGEFSRTENPMITATIEVPPVATFDFKSAWLDGTAYLADLVKWTAGSRSLQIDFADVRMGIPDLDVSQRPTLVKVVGIVSRTVGDAFDFKMTWS